MLENLLDGITEDDAKIIAECIFLKHPNAVKDIKALPASRLNLFNLICEGINDIDELESITELKRNNIWTQIKMLIEEGYIKKVAKPDHKTTYRPATTSEIIGDEES